MAPHSSTLAWKVPWTHTQCIPCASASSRPDKDEAASGRNSLGSKTFCSEGFCSGLLAVHSKADIFGVWMDFDHLVMVKNPPAMQETQVWYLGQEDPLQKGMATHSQYSCLENPMDRGAWRATVHGVTKSWTWHLFYGWGNWVQRCEKTHPDSHSGVRTRTRTRTQLPAL